MTLSLYYLPLFPTTWFEYKRKSIRLQAVFSGEKPVPACNFCHFSSKTVVFKQVFDTLSASLRKMKQRPSTTSCAIGAVSLLIPTKSRELSKSFPNSIGVFHKLFRITVDPTHASVSSASADRPSSLSRCSCILAAEALRNRTRCCFTSSRAIWTASSVRARASSAYSLVT